MAFGCRWRLMAAPWETTAWSFTGAGCTSLRNNHAVLRPPVYPISRLRRRLQSVGPTAVPAPAPVLSNSLSDRCTTTSLSCSIVIAAIVASFANSQRFWPQFMPNSAQEVMPNNSQIDSDRQSRSTDGTIGDQYAKKETAGHHRRPRL